MQLHSNFKIGQYLPGHRWYGKKYIEFQDKAMVTKNQQVTFSRPDAGADQHDALRFPIRDGDLTSVGYVYTLLRKHTPPTQDRVYARRATPDQIKDNVAIGHPEWIFSTTKVIGVNSISDLLRDLSQQAGIEDWEGKTNHRLKAWALERLANSSKCNPKDTQRLARHKTLNMQAEYIGVSEESEANRCEALGQGAFGDEQFFAPVPAAPKKQVVDDRKLPPVQIRGANSERLLPQVGGPATFSMVTHHHHHGPSFSHQQQQQILQNHQEPSASQNVSGDAALLSQHGISQELLEQCFCDSPVISPKPPPVVSTASSVARAASQPSSGVSHGPTQFQGRRQDTVFSPQFQSNQIHLSGGSYHHQTPHVRQPINPQAQAMNPYLQRSVAQNYNCASQQSNPYVRRY